MPRRKPDKLDAVRYELGTYERQLAKDALFVQGIKAASIPLGAGLLALGIGTAGFLMYNKVDDLKEWVSDQWTDGFGLVNDPTQTQDQVGGYVAPTRGALVSSEFDGMPVHTIYQIHYDERFDLLQYFARQWCRWEGIDYTGPNQERFKVEVWSSSFLGTPLLNIATYRFERNEIVNTIESDNEISEYVYQMIIRETDSRNTQARLTSGALGAISTGIGAAFSEATHWALRSSGFMRGSDGWDGQNWEEAPGANLDPLLMYAWGRTDFQTGKWWSTADSLGNVTFWTDRLQGIGGYDVPGANPPEQFEKFTYEQIIHQAHQEMTDGEWFGPCLTFIANRLGMSLVAPENPLETEPTPVLTEEEEEAIQEQGQQDQQDASNESGRDDYMPGEEPPEDENDQYGPPRS
jgi:hypothetical protein